MRGLDPRIHDEFPRIIALRLCSRRGLMDFLVKPGNDRVWVGLWCRWHGSRHRRGAMFDRHARRRVQE
jgi:hypothetical protein